MKETINCYEKLENETNRQYAYRILKDEIMSWKLTPGEVLNDLQISTRLGISRTPVREALFSLKEDHLVNIYARNKTTVSLIDWRLITEGRFVRTSLETLIASELCGKLTREIIGELSENLALQRNLVEGGYGTKTFYELDNEFHRILYHAVDKDETYEMVRRMCYQVDRVRYLMIPRANLMPNMLESHREILDYIINNQKDKLVSTLANHINDVFHDDGTPSAFAVNLLETHPEYFCNVPSEIRRS